MSAPHRSDVQEQEPCGWWREAAPLPFYLRFRMQCECGRKFWRESDYLDHWHFENAASVLANPQEDK